MIWHFQGSGKSLLMVFAAQKLRMHPAFKNPTVLIVVDRIDLDTQIIGTFTSSDIPNPEKADTREKLEQFLSQDTRKIIIATIFKFGEATGCLNARSNIIALVDEAHRTQEGDLGRKMRLALPNAFLFELTGTPINRADRNTFFAFGAEEDAKGYMSRYGFEESIRDSSDLRRELHEAGGCFRAIALQEIGTGHSSLSLFGRLSLCDWRGRRRRSRRTFLSVIIRTPFHTPNCMPVWTECSTGVFVTAWEKSRAALLSISVPRRAGSRVASSVKICASKLARDTETYANRLFTRSGCAAWSTWTSTRSAVSPCALWLVTA